MARTIARDHEEKRQAILATAATFFAENGFDRSSMNQLATACGVSKALIYHYYDSKDALLFDIVQTHLLDLLKAIRAVDVTGDPEDALRRLARAILAAYRGADAQHEVQAVAMETLPDVQRRILSGLQKEMVGLVADVLKRATPDLYEGSPATLTPVTMSFFGMLNWFYMWHRPGKGLSREAYADLVTDLTLGGVRGLAP
jgi:AcrR family transcriptional regulator